MNMNLFRRSRMQAATLALCTTILCAMPLMAQDTTPPPPPHDHMGPMGGHDGSGKMHEHQLAMLTKELNLTPDQVTQVKTIQDDTMKQAMALRDDTSIAKADKRQKMMDIHNAAQEKIRAVLTDEQKTKYDALQAQMRERMKERRESHEGGTGSAPTPPPPPPQ